MPCLVEYAAGKLYRLVCPADAGRLPGPCRRRFGCNRHGDVPGNDNNLREPLIRFCRTAAFTVRATRFDEQRDGPDDLNFDVSALGQLLCNARSSVSDLLGISGNGDMLCPGKAETGIG